LKDLRKRNLKLKKTPIQTQKRNVNVLSVNQELQVPAVDRLKEIKELYQETIDQDLEELEEVKDHLLLRKKSQLKQKFKNKLEKPSRNYKENLPKEKERNIVEIKEKLIVSNLMQNWKRRR